MYRTELSCDGHSRYFIVSQATLGGGWELRIEEDHRVTKRVRYTDWHRVERALGDISRRVAELQSGGWRVTVPAP
jgi:hypothetical protein